MDPRLKSSTQWSPFPAELCELIVSALGDRFTDEYGLEDYQFVAEGRIYQQEILTRVGLSVPGQLKQHNFEFSYEYDNTKEKTLELIQSSMDVIEHVWTEFLEEDMEDTEMPREWQTMPYKKMMYFFKYSTVNTNLEAEADKLLKEYEDKLVYEESSVEDDDPTLH